MARPPTAQQTDPPASVSKPQPAASRAVLDGQVRPLLQDCRALMSERGEANGPGIAQGVVAASDDLGDALRGRFYEHLARDFSPEPAKVLAAAQAYAAAPAQVDALVRLTQGAEPPRQELFRRLNRAPGGTAAIVRRRRGLLERLPRQQPRQNNNATTPRPP